LGLDDEKMVIVDTWSIKNEILDKDIFNDENEKIGIVEDIIVTPDKSMSYAVVSTGGFLGLAKHDVVLPVHEFRTYNKNIVFPGATKEAVKAMPEFKYAV
jgi:sporulation protein YlmC with PRC-barrel domain